jgi:hypothetical protein
MSILKKLGVQSEPNASTIPVTDEEVSAAGAVAVDAGVSSDIDVPLSEDIFIDQSTLTGDFSTRPSVLHLDSNDSEDCKCKEDNEEGELNMRMGELEHEKLAGLCYSNDAHSFDLNDKGISMRPSTFVAATA